MIRHLAAGRAGSAQASFTYFVPDPQKSGGQYVTVSGQIRKVDQNRGQIILQDGLRIPIGEIIDIS